MTVKITINDLFSLWQTSHGIALFSFHLNRSLDELFISKNEGFTVMSWISPLLSVLVKEQHSNVTTRGPRYVEVANCAVAMDAQAQLLCYPWRSFYPLSPVLSTKYTRIT